MSLQRPTGLLMVGSPENLLPPIFDKAKPKVEIDLNKPIDNEMKSALFSLQALQCQKKMYVLQAGYHELDDKIVFLKQSCVMFPRKKKKNDHVFKYAIINQYIASGKFGAVYASDQTLKISPTDIYLGERKTHKARIVKNLAHNFITLQEPDPANLKDIGVIRLMAEHESMMMSLLPGYHSKQYVEDPILKSDFLISRQFPGKTLFSMLEDPNTKWSLEKRLVVCLNLIRAFTKLADKGIAHRDVKDENIMVDDAGNVYIIDLGLAVTADINTAGSDEGAYLCKSPEGLAKLRSVPLDDVFSVGKLCWAILTDSKRLDLLYPYPRDPQDPTNRANAAVRRATLDKLEAGLMPTPECLFVNELGDSKAKKILFDTYPILVEMNAKRDQRIDIYQCEKKFEALTRRYPVQSGSPLPAVAAANTAAAMGAAPSVRTTSPMAAHKPSVAKSSPLTARALTANSSPVVNSPTVARLSQVAPKVAVIKSSSLQATPASPAMFRAVTASAPTNGRTSANDVMKPIPRKYIAVSSGLVRSASASPAAPNATVAVSAAEVSFMRLFTAVHTPAAVITTEPMSITTSATRINRNTSPIVSKS